ATVGAAIACGSACSHAYASGTTVSLLATAADGSTFVGWGGACSGSGACAVVMDQARAVSATFSKTTTGALKSSGRSAAGAPIHFTATLPMSALITCEWQFGDGASEA